MTRAEGVRNVMSRQFGSLLRIWRHDLFCLASMSYSQICKGVFAMLSDLWDRSYADENSMATPPPSFTYHHSNLSTEESTPIVRTTKQAFSLPKPRISKCTRLENASLAVGYINTKSPLLPSNAYGRHQPRLDFSKPATQLPPSSQLLHVTQSRNTRWCRFGRSLLAQGRESLALCPQSSAEAMKMTQRSLITVFRTGSLPFCVRIRNYLPQN